LFALCINYGEVRKCFAIFYFYEQLNPAFHGNLLLVVALNFLCGNNVLFDELVLHSQKRKRISVSIRARLRAV
jgi:hypothetical protein